MLHHLLFKISRKYHRKAFLTKLKIQHRLFVCFTSKILGVYKKNTRKALCEDGRNRTGLNTLDTGLLFNKMLLVCLLFIITLYRVVSRVCLYNHIIYCQLEKYHELFAIKTRSVFSILSGFEERKINFPVGIVKAVKN